MPDLEVTIDYSFEIEAAEETNEIGVTLGDIYIPTAAENAERGALNKAQFVLTADATTVFVINNEARQVMHVMINGIDYVEWCSLDTGDNPGYVTYAVPVDGYEPEIGDSVIIYWTK